jgi:hypothetical protein
MMKNTAQTKTPVCRTTDSLIQGVVLSAKRTKPRIDGQQQLPRAAKQWLG